MLYYNYIKPDKVCLHDSASIGFLNHVFAIDMQYPDMIAAIYLLTQTAEINDLAWKSQAHNFCQSFSSYTCSIVSVVRTPKMTGIPVSIPALNVPPVAEFTTAS